MSHLPVCFKNILKFLQKWIVDLKRKIYFSENIKSKSNLTMNWTASDTIAAVLQTLTFFGGYLYMCENGFLALTNMKTKDRFRLHVESDLWVCL